MRQPRIDAHHGGRASEEARQLLECHAGRHFGPGQRGRDARGASALLVASPRHHHGRAERAAELDPALLGPQLVLAARHGEEHRIGRLAGRVLRRLQSIDERQVKLVAEGRGREAAVALHRVHAARHRIAVLVEASGDRFTCARGIHAVALADGAGRDQRALRERLRIDHGVVTLRGNVCPEFADFPPRRRAPPRAAPAPQPHRDHATHRRVHRRDARERFLDDPVDFDTRTLARHVADRGTVMHHVAERRGLDEEDLKRRTKPFRMSAAIVGDNPG